MTEAEKWILGCTLVMAIGTIAAVVISIISLNKKQEVQLQQPVNVTVTEELHNLFASRSEFERHVEQTRQNFAQRDTQRGDDLRAAAGSRKIIYDKIESSAKDLKADLDEKHGINEKRINRSNWMLARLCERNRIPVPSEDETL